MSASPPTAEKRPKLPDFRIGPEAENIALQMIGQATPYRRGTCHHCRRTVCANVHIARRKPCGGAKTEAVDGCQTKDPASRASQHRSLVRGTPRNVGLRRTDVATNGSTPSNHRHLFGRSIP